MLHAGISENQTLISDINECASSPCQQKCINLPGTYACACHRGFKEIINSETKNTECVGKS